MIKDVFIILIGLAGGLITGGGFVATLTVLGIIPRLVQMTKTKNKIRFYEWSVIAGAVSGTWFGLRNDQLSLPVLLVIPIGLFSGIFIGMVAAALTEVLNVIPIVSKRIGIHQQILTLLMAIVLGKIFGSLFHWAIFVKI
ncbi:stage V sporulation protein AB [Terrilactibacillus laevilacticus]|uniref:Stage V sporulation protein AB n=1 Tax=Terrilactibacillus laevilacticus TaxID=1380157 RepID=A0ABW5PS46_9BACI|nr:stage V sporulation protein AB [Terrilactibacillus laevilacticus]